MRVSLSAWIPCLVLLFITGPALALVAESEQCLVFPPLSPHRHPLDPLSLATAAWDWASSIFFGRHTGREGSDEPFVFATSHHALPLILSSSDSPAVHLAAASFAEDIYRTTGSRPAIYNDTLPPTSGSRGWFRRPKGQRRAIVVGSIDAWPSLSASPSDAGAAADLVDGLRGKWEAWSASVVRGSALGPSLGLGEADEALLLAGSDRRGTIYALYTLSEQMGVSPFHFWADVPPTPRPVLAFERQPTGQSPRQGGQDGRATCGHGEPSIRYRGLFINDELPALWNWAHETYGIPWGERPFQTGMYERVFELLLRLRANYLWPAMWASSFAVDGLSSTHLGPPAPPTPGPNQLLAERMGLVMGTSHHEPMSRNKQEWDDGGAGAWDWTNREKLEEWWRYGAERARAAGAETVFTVGLRGDGDGPLTGASKELLEGVVDVQRGILASVYDSANASSALASAPASPSSAPSVPMMWAMYKEVQGYFQDGMKVPDDVTILLSDDNWGNVMAVPPEEMRDHPGGFGLYYHGEYVGRPRDYKWINTISLAKMWQQLNLAYHTDIHQIWILNVGDLKLLEIPLDYFTSLAYDWDTWGARNALAGWMRQWAAREFGAEVAEQAAEVLGVYSQYVSRIKPELLNATLFSLENYDEANLRLAEWTALETQSTAVHARLAALDPARATAYFELLHSVVLLMTNLQRLYVAVGLNNLHADQARSSANLRAADALAYFERDRALTREYHELYDGRWNWMLVQTHIHYDWWAERQREVMPPVSYIDGYLPAVPAREGRPPGLPAYLRYTIENSRGAWPGRSPQNCDGGWECWVPTLRKMDPWGAQRRWIEVSSGGPRDTRWTVSANESWVRLSETEGEIKADGSTDTRVWVEVDWDRVPTASSSAADWFNGSAAIEFADSHGMNQTVLLPIVKPPSPPTGFHGFVEGDGYVVIEAAHQTGNASAGAFAWQEIDMYGRTLSGLEVLPVDTSVNFTAGQGPMLAYDFYATGASRYTAGNTDGRVEVTVQVGPTFNYVLGERLALALQMDAQAPVVRMPIPPTEVSGEQGTTPLDWWNVVSSEVRNVTATFDLGTAEAGAGAQGVERGKHTLRIWGMTGGMVVQRIWVDFGGIAQRGYSYLGPPESKRV